MGWKALKDAFSIGHIVSVEKGKVCIGSPYVRDLATIDPKTGAIDEGRVSPGFLLQYYPALKAAPAQDIVRLLESEDKFSDSIVVYTYEGPKIIEKLCEKLGYPNVTHDGLIMYDNQYSADREQVIAWAKKNLELEKSGLTREIDRLESDLRGLKESLAACISDLEEFDSQHPGVAFERPEAA